MYGLHFGVGERHGHPLGSDSCASWTGCLWLKEADTGGGGYVADPNKNAIYINPVLYTVGFLFQKNCNDAFWKNFIAQFFEFWSIPRTFDHQHVTILFSFPHCWGIIHAVTLLNKSEVVIKKCRWPEKKEKAIKQRNGEKSFTKLNLQNPI